MSKFQHDVMLKIVKVIDLVMITIPFALCWELYYSYQVYAKFGWRGNWAMIGLFAVLFFLLGKVYDAFWMSLQRISELLYGQILAAMATDGVLYIVICLMSRRLCNILPGIAAIAGQVVMAALWARLRSLCDITRAMNICLFWAAAKRKPSAKQKRMIMYGCWDFRLTRLHTFVQKHLKLFSASWAKVPRTRHLLSAAAGQLSSSAARCRSWKEVRHFLHTNFLCSAHFVSL